VLQMDNIRMLKEHAKTGASLYALLKARRIEDRSILQKPFGQVDPRDVIRMIYKWLWERKGRMTIVQLRMHDPGHGIMHYVGLRVHRGHVYVLYVHDLPSNQQQVTHVWKLSTIFANLTIEEIHASVETAQEVNQLLTLRRAYNEVPTLGASTEQWLPEVKDT